ncbi:MAG TPA: NAD-dependent succinate-semialdehyde dehydrogenase [Nitrososphaeraceae archaeon]|nr:NAD-dependent succinate-semialdehyde dehydrogenase [Thermoproteota archaeon]HZA62844.1 NAD-dependent succinate-semialdehyde dehydrogenase [Nitrososphaeraceae archaeon]
MSNTIETINPSTGKVIATYNSMTSEEVSQKTKNSRIAFENWRKIDISERCTYMRRLGRVMKKNKEDYAKLITEEMGKPIRQSLAEIDKCAWVCDYYSEHAESFLRDELIPTEFRKSFVSFEPLGVIACIMPWNFPFWQVMRFAVPALTAGNVGILKHSSICMGTALQIEQAFKNAGFPENTFQSIIGDYRAGEALVESGIDAVSVTGSVNTGRRVAELATKDLKKFVLELGGSDPFIVLEDADLSQTAHMAAQSRLLNNGQSCIAAKRFIVVKDIVEKFTKLFVEETESEVVGEPMDSKTTVGPLVRESQREALAQQVDDAKTKGASILTGGNSIKRDGFFYEPTIVSQVDHGMKIIKEEVFGPAAPIIVVNNEEEAIREANNSEFGLGASIWTNNIERGIRLAREVQSGIVSVNEMVRSDPRLPFGGIKHSGIGRELSEIGIKEFVNVKSVVVKDITSRLLVE